MRRHSTQHPAPPMCQALPPPQAGAGDEALGHAGSQETNDRSLSPKACVKRPGKPRGVNAGGRQCGRHLGREGAGEGGAAGAGGREGSTGHHPGHCGCQQGSKSLDQPSPSADTRCTGELQGDWPQGLWQPPQGDPRKLSFPGRKKAPRKCRAMPPPPQGPQRLLVKGAVRMPPTDLDQRGGLVASGEVPVAVWASRGMGLGFCGAPSSWQGEGRGLGTSEHP